MIRTPYLFFAIFATLLSGHPALAEDKTIRIQASTDWYLSYEDDSCRLVREFGEGNKKVVIKMVRFGPGDGFRLTLAGEPVELRKSRRRYQVRFGEFEPYQKVNFGLGKLGELPALVGFQQMIIGPWKKDETKTPTTSQGERLEYARYSIAEERYASARHIYLDLPHRKPMVLLTGSLGKPFAAFDKCVDKLMEDWGIDIARHKERAISVRPASRPDRWMRSSDYPTKMLRKSQPGLVNFRLSVDEKGQATDCHIQETTRPQAFDNAVCKGLMKRSKFHPALDTQGKPMASYYRNAVRFTMN